MPTEDVKKGECGCGACRHLRAEYVNDHIECLAVDDYDFPEYIWVAMHTAAWDAHDEHQPSEDDVRGLVIMPNRCPYGCDHRLDADGTAPRMVDWTVEEARPAIEQIVALLLLRPLAVPGAWSEEINAQLADELKRLLPEEGSE